MVYKSKSEEGYHASHLETCYGSAQSTGDKAECRNYRPISVLCGISKVIERHVHDALYIYLTQHSLLFSEQSGFRPGHSCETALLRMNDTWAAAIDRGDINCVILLDLRKAFDLINHECLLKKINIYQCDDNANTWFSSYLTGRTQQTTFIGQLSKTAAITAGARQGSIIGPLLFILYMNDLPLHIHNDINTFADDSTLHTTGPNIEEIQLSLQADLNVKTTWCTHNEMVINTSKTKATIITTQQRRHHLQNDMLSITLNEHNLQQVNQQKVIGVVVDENLKWREHVNGVYKKISQTLALFLRIKQFLPQRSRLLFYNSYIMPHLDYCVTVCGIVVILSGWRNSKHRHQ